jgi:hypothetical protein
MCRFEVTFGPPLRRGRSSLVDSISTSPEDLRLAAEKEKRDVGNAPGVPLAIDCAPFFRLLRCEIT